jgi:hypothetical protein
VRSKMLEFGNVLVVSFKETDLEYYVGRDDRWCMVRGEDISSVSDTYTLTELRRAYDVETMRPLMTQIKVAIGQIKKGQ